MTSLVPSQYHLLRNPHTRALYDALDAAGVTVSILELYEVDLTDDRRTHATDDAAGAVVELRDATAVPLSPSEPAEPREGDRAVVATDGDDVVGWQYVADRTVEVPPLDASISTPGAYLWGLYVTPACRRRGIATRLVARALEYVSETGRHCAAAIVGADNVPSKRLLSANGFAPTRRLVYCRLRGLEWRYERPLAGGREGT